MESLRLFHAFNMTEWTWLFNMVICAAASICSFAMHVLIQKPVTYPTIERTFSGFKTTIDKTITIIQTHFKDKGIDAIHYRRINCRSDLLLNVYITIRSRKQWRVHFETFIREIYKYLMKCGVKNAYFLAQNCIMSNFSKVTLTENYEYFIKSSLKYHNQH